MVVIPKSSKDVLKILSAGVDPSWQKVIGWTAVPFLHPQPDVPPASFFQYNELYKSKARSPDELNCDYFQLLKLINRSLSGSFFSSVSSSFVSSAISMDFEGKFKSAGNEVEGEGIISEGIGVDFTGTSGMSFKWEKEEVVNATGNEESTLMFHSLNLKSAYSQAQVQRYCESTFPWSLCDNYSIQRHLGGQSEPYVTQYHLKFCGTVDYIW